MGQINIACSSEPPSHSVVDSFNYIIQGGTGPLKALRYFVYEWLIQKSKVQIPTPNQAEKEFKLVTLKPLG